MGIINKLVKTFIGIISCVLFIIVIMLILSIVFIFGIIIYVIAFIINPKRVIKNFKNKDNYFSGILPDSRIE